MSTSELKNCRQHFFAVSKYFLNVDGKMVSKMKQINVKCRLKKCQRTKMFFAITFLKVSEQTIGCLIIFFTFGI